jgi:8-hydroxy-5-deazaflavin:NADPH oxidoreductase
MAEVSGRSGGPAPEGGPPEGRGGSEPAGGVTELVVGVLGGTGPLGGGLARRFAAAGATVVVGSRDAARGAAVAAEILADVPGTAVSGTDNATVAERADLVVVAVPYEGHADLLRGLAGPLAGTIVVDAVNPLGFDKQGAYALDVPEGSAAQQAAALLPDSRVTAAFHHVSAPLLNDLTVPRVELDVLVLGEGEDRAATDTVQALAELIPGVRGVYGGRLRNAGQVEALTANLIAINRRYKAHSGIRVTDV